MKEKISSLTSSTISALRFPLTVGVVFIHFNVLSDNLAVRGTGNAEHFPTWLVCMFNLFSEVLPRIAVPLFFIISGYLFFRSGFMIRTYTDKLRRRVRTLLVPYILWNLLYLIRTAFRDIPAFSGLSHDTAQANWSLSAVLACFWDKSRGVFPVPASSYIYPQDFPLWYVRDLMVMVVLAPVLYWMLKKVGWLAVVVLGMVWLTLHSICNITYWGQFFTAAFFFSWGACYGLKGMDLVASMRHRTWIALLYPLWAVADMLKVEGIYGIYIHNIGIIFSGRADGILVGTRCHPGEQVLVGWQFLPVCPTRFAHARLSKVYHKSIFRGQSFLYGCTLFHRALLDYCRLIRTLRVASAIYTPDLRSVDGRAMTLFRFSLA